MILTGELLAIIIDTNGGLHKTGEGRKYVDWWVDLPVVKLAINKDLALSNVTSQIWDGMSDIIVGHGQNG